MVEALQHGRHVAREAVIGTPQADEGFNSSVAPYPLDLLINSPARPGARRPSAGCAFHIGHAWIMCGQISSASLATS